MLYLYKKVRIISEVFYWKEKLHIRNFLFGIDNNTKYVGYVCGANSKTPHLFLNIKQLLKDTYEENVATIFHEFGHIEHRTIYRNNKQQIKAEILAEKYALKQLKKYLPKAYKKHIKDWKVCLQKPNWRKEYPIHYKAFSQIKAYQED